jgi:hypothetical protein
MKKYILFTVCLLIPVLLLAQPGLINKIFDKYDGKDGFTSVMLTDPAQLMGNDLSKSLAKGIKNLKEFKLLTFDPGNKKNLKMGKEFANEIKKLDNIPDYKSFLSVNSEGTFVRMYFKKTGEKVTEFLMVVSSEEEESVLIWITGELDLNKLGKMGTQQNEKGPDDKDDE